MTDVGTATGPKAAIRNVAMFLIGHLPRLAAAGAANQTETTINYRGSALSVHLGATTTAPRGRASTPPTRTACSARTARR